MNLRIDYIVNDKVVGSESCARSVRPGEAKAIATKRLADINGHLARIVDEDTGQEVALIRR